MKRNPFVIVFVVALGVLAFPLVAHSQIQTSKRVAGVSERVSMIAKVSSVDFKKHSFKVAGFGQEISWNEQTQFALKSRKMTSIAPSAIAVGKTIVVKALQGLEGRITAIEVWLPPPTAVNPVLSPRECANMGCEVVEDGSCPRLPFGERLTGGGMNNKLRCRCSSGTQCIDENSEPRD